MQMAPMRYISTIAMTVPLFVAETVWAAIGLGPWTICFALLTGIAISVLIGWYMCTGLRRYLFHGQTNFLLRRPPGGVWFFILLGLLIGVIGAPLLMILGGSLLLRTVGVTVGTIAAGSFGIVGIYVLRLERSQGKRIFMWPDGFFFEENGHDSSIDSGRLPE